MVGGSGTLAVYSQRRNSRTENVLELQHFEDLPLGGEWTTRRRTLTEADLTAFVGISGDYNPLYADLEHAKASVFGGPVAPGTLVAAMTTGLGSIDVPLPATVGMVGMSWKFLLPVQPGDTISSRWRLSRKRNVENPNWGLAVWQVEVENQRGEIVASAEVARLVARREQPAEASRSSRRRRRRKGAPAGQAAADVVLQEPVPEPAPADLPLPTARRRRRRGPAEPASEPPAEVVEPAAAPRAAEEPPPGEAQPSRRRRRRRGGNGGNGNSNNRDAGRAPDTPPNAEPAGAAPAPSPQPPAEATAGGGGRVEPGDGAGGRMEPEDGAGGLGRVLRRLRGA